jgi:hypothetical protein
MRGELTSDQVETLTSAGLAVAGDVREMLAGRGEPPIEWHVLRTFVRAPGDSEDEAKSQVAAALELEPGDLVAYSADIFARGLAPASPVAAALLAGVRSSR